MSANCAVDIVKSSLFKLLNRSGPIWVGGEASQAQPAQVLSWVAFAASWSITVLGCTELTDHVLSSSLWNLIFTQTYYQKRVKNNTSTKGFYLKCSWKCLIQLCMHSDSPIIHLCKFSERQTAESFWYHVHFWASPCPCLREEKGRQGSRESCLKRQTREYITIHSGVSLYMCVFPYPGYLPPPKRHSIEPLYLPQWCTLMSLKKPPWYSTVSPSLRNTYLTFTQAFYPVTS